MQILYTYPVESLVVKASAEREREWELCSPRTLQNLFYLIV